MVAVRPHTPRPLVLRTRGYSPLRGPVVVPREQRHLAAGAAAAVG